MPKNLEFFGFDDGVSIGGLLEESGQEEEETTPPPVFNELGGNFEFAQFNQDPELILDSLQSTLLKEILTQLSALGYDPVGGSQVWGAWQPHFISSWYDGVVARAEADKKATLRAIQAGSRLSGIDANTDFEAVLNNMDPSTNSMGAQYYLRTMEGFESLKAQAWQYWQSKIPLLQDIGTLKPAPRGGGRRRPTKEEIRNQFDVDQLSEAATGIWRQMLLDEPTNARDMASAYVEAIVETRGEKTIDFATFIKGKARDTSRWAAIYSNKPESLSEEQFLMPYHQAALQVLQPENAAGVAIGGAQFGASASAFAERLRRSDEATSTSNFVTSLESRMNDLKGVLRG